VGAILEAEVWRMSQVADVSENTPLLRLLTLSPTIRAILAA